MVDLTTEQQVPFTFVVRDGRGRPAAIDGAPTAVSSDETVVTVEPLTSSDNISWAGTVVSVAPGSARVAVTADSDITPEGVNDVVGMLDCNVTLDPRTGARISDLQAGAPTDKPV